MDFWVQPRHSEKKAEMTAEAAAGSGGAPFSWVEDREQELDKNLDKKVHEFKSFSTAREIHRDETVKLKWCLRDLEDQVRHLEGEVKYHKEQKKEDGKGGVEEMRRGPQAGRHLLSCLKNPTEITPKSLASPSCGQCKKRKTVRIRLATKVRHFPFSALRGSGGVCAPALPPLHKLGRLTPNRCWVQGNFGPGR